MLSAEELRNSADPQLQLLRDRARQVQSLRNDDETVSRSTILYSAATISPLVLAVLEINGLSVRAWERSLGFDQRPALGVPEPAANFQVRDDTEAALGEYSRRWPERNIDVLGVVTAIFLRLSGNARRHFTSAGLDIKAASQQFVRFFDVTRDGLVNYAELGYLFSERTRRIFDAARSLNQKFNVEYRALTASQIAIAAASFADDHPAAATTFLRRYMQAKAGADEFGNVIDRWMRWYRTGPTSSYDRWTQTLAAIVLRAQHLSEQTRNRPEIAARHLIGALIATDRWAANSGVPRLCSEAGIDQRKLARAFFDDYLAVSPTDDTQPRRDDLDVWRNFLGLGTELSVPRFNAEDVTGEDLLNVKDDVNAFASLVASNRIDPPLSIGLFGNWGSGKSFFMAKMREAIARRAESARGRNDSVFHQRIVQIDFNAWHYFEANLWASMVEHLFRNLKLTYESPRDEAVSARREELLKQLDMLMAEKVAAEENVKKAEIERDRAAQELDAAKKAADASAAAARNLHAKDVWDLVTIDKPTREDLQKALEQLGAGKVLASTADIRKTVEELRSVRTRTSLLANWIVRQPRSLVLLLGFLVLAPFLAMAIAGLARLIAPETYAAIAKSVSQVTAFVTAVTAWLAQRLSSGKKLLSWVDASRAKIDDLVDAEAGKIRGDIQTADNALADAVASVANAQKAVLNCEKNVVDAKNELLKLTNGYRLNRFIDERAASDDYRKLLGVLATVRSDFATLSELMHPRGRKSNLDDQLRIDRIILYIDDLDRCEPDRVIKVLQAVHLLLAFKLFVVVVGVDARWVSESLRQKHRALRGKNGHADEDDDEVAGYAVEPHDYLEKIFQVPFWLDALEPRTAGAYIADLLADDLPTESAAERRDQSSAASNAGDQQPAAAQQQAPEVLHTMGEEDDQESDPKQLTIEPKERDYMKREELARLVSRSPRTAKRLVNTYRFFRASLARESLAHYLDEQTPPAEYRCALLMLAIVVGAPDVSLELFEQMRVETNPERSLETFVKIIKIDDEHASEWAIVVQALREFGETENARLSDLLRQIDRVSRYSFRPPHNLQEKNLSAVEEPRIAIKKTDRGAPATPPIPSNTASPRRASRRS